MINRALSADIKTFWTTSNNQLEINSINKFDNPDEAISTSCFELPTWKISKTLILDNILML